MNSNDELKLFNELYKLYENTKGEVAHEPFTFWVKPKAESGIFNGTQNTSYTNVGIVQIQSSAFREPFVGFRFHGNEVVLRIGKASEKADVDKFINKAKKINEHLLKHQIVIFLEEAQKQFGSWKHSWIEINDDLIEKLRNEYNYFFSFVKKYDSDHSTNFYDILKISNKIFEENVKKNKELKHSISVVEEPHVEEKEPKTDGKSTDHEGMIQDGDDNTKPPLNLILYGPPGTGKTYNTLFKALEIIEGKTKKELEKEKKDQDDQWEKDTNKPKTVKKGYEVLKGRYDNYVKTGQIVFTTFHQSMSYEDFIEGIKPIPVSGKDEKDKIIAIHKNETPSSKNPQFGVGVTTITDPTRMKYEVKDGIFKHLCKYDITIIYNIFKNVYPIGKTFSYFSSRKVDLPITDYKDEELVFYYKFGNQKPRPVYVKAMEGMLEQNADFDINKYMEISTGKPSKSENPDRGLAVYLKEFYNKFLEIKNKWPRILIIDEINRGNVAQIFGELITLIEPSKRLDNDEAMTATLPYSQKTFGVPNNLYIIGTMNTADRSVEALDTALRRRFFFEEMMPDKSLLTGKTVCGVDLGLLLETINKRIVALKDREHQIGHSYFMDDCLKGKEEKAKEQWLANVFKDKIIPLLQEYFYGDYKKIYYVLGPGFVEDSYAGTKEDSIRKKLFPFVDSNDQELDISEEKYEIRPFDDDPQNKKDNKVIVNAAVNKLVNSEKYREYEVEFKAEKYTEEGNENEIDVKYVIERIFNGEQKDKFKPVEKKTENPK